jgi:hypothetical protein
VFVAIGSGKRFLNVQCLFWFSLQILSETLLIIGRTERDIMNVHVKYPLFLSYFNGCSIFSTDFRNTVKYQISWRSV